MQWLPTDGAIGVERIAFGAHQLASSARRTQRPGRISEDAPVDETDAQGMKTARAKKPKPGRTETGVRPAILQFSFHANLYSNYPQFFCIQENLSRAG